MNSNLYHAGIKGMKWGRRRYQNPDGTLTPEGKKRYDKDPSNDFDSEKSAKMVADGQAATEKALKKNRRKTVAAVAVGTTVSVGAALTMYAGYTVLNLLTLGGVDRFFGIGSAKRGKRK